MEFCRNGFKSMKAFAYQTAPRRIPNDNSYQIFEHSNAKISNKFLTTTTVRLAILAGIALSTSAFAVVTMEYVSVGHAGNAADPATGSLYGAVAYAYQIGKYEVTNVQYVEFLNAVDPGGGNVNGVYNAYMGSDVRRGITYTAGAVDGAKYMIRSSMGDKPVNYVSWYDAARFTNWLHNGQGSGGTETGAYTLSGNTSLITKNPGATVYLPSENEWYKAVITTRQRELEAATIIGRTRPRVTQHRQWEPPTAQASSRIRARTWQIMGRERSGTARPVT
jgi:hypothetical protein